MRIIVFTIKITDRQVYWEPSFVILSLWVFLSIFPSSGFFLVFKYFSFYTRSLSDQFLIAVPTLSQISCYFFINSLSFIKKNIFSFIKISSICSQFWKHYTQRLNFFTIIFVANKIFKTFFTKMNLVRYYCFINVYDKYWNWVFVLLKFIPFNFNITKNYKFFTNFISGNNFLYNTFSKSNQHFEVNLLCRFC